MAMDPVSGCLAVLGVIAVRVVMTALQCQGARLGLRAAEKIEDALRLGGRRGPGKWGGKE
jgi:hypothetical protein